MKKLLIILVFVFVCIQSSYAAYQTLEIINIKAAGSGSPAIPAGARIFYAYTGIEYNIRAAVIGGVYPYTYSLSNAPVGMTIKSRTGEITWTNPTSSASDIVLTVTDSDSTQVQATWSITVTTSTTYFRFVDSSYSGDETGSISQPYSSIANLWSSGFTGITYFRTGTYSIGNGGWKTGPVAWLAYPGESVLIDMNDHELAYWGIVYFDRLTFYNMDYSGEVSYSGVVVCDSYTTIRRCTFRDFSNTIETNNNYGMLKAMCTDDPYYYYMVFQDNVFYNFLGGNAIGSIYHQYKMLIENNYIYNALGQGSGPSHNGISPKVSVRYFTVRGNKIVMGYGWLWGCNNSAMEDNIESCFNLFVTTGDRSGGMENWNLSQTTTWFYRNTLIGDYVIRSCTDSGPYTISYNVISNPNTNWLWGSISNYITYNNGTDCFTESNNLTNTTASTLVDSSNEYKLQAAYSEYVGTRGWQLSDGYTPMELGELDEEEASSGTTGYGITMQGVTLQ